MIHNLVYSELKLQNKQAMPMDAINWMSWTKRLHGLIKSGMLII